MHSGNADPEPAGWQRLANMLHNRDLVDLQVDLVDPARLPADAAVVHITSTDAFKLYDEQLTRVRKYLDAGGLLLADAAGGSSTANASIEDLMRSLYPAGKLEPLPIDHPIYAAGGTKIRQVTYRKFAIDKLPPGCGCGPDERIVRIPRSVLTQAKSHIPEPDLNVPRNRVGKR